MYESKESAIRNYILRCCFDITETKEGCVGNFRRASRNFNIGDKVLVFYPESIYDKKRDIENNFMSNGEEGTVVKKVMEYELPKLLIKLSAPTKETLRNGAVLITEKYIEIVGRTGTYFLDEKELLKNSNLGNELYAPTHKRALTPEEIKEYLIIKKESENSPF